MTLTYRKITKEPLTKNDWVEVYHATLAYQFQLRIIVARARARKEIPIQVKKEATHETKD